MEAQNVGEPKISFETKLYQALGQFDGYYTKPPLDHRKTEIAGLIICMNNDGFEVWIGTKDEWHTHFKNADFRKICFWYLKVWIFVDWFGLRSFVWYKLLTRRCNKHKLTTSEKDG